MAQDRERALPSNSDETSVNEVIELLYAVFAKYPKPKNLLSSPSRDSVAIFNEITSAPLRQLPDDKLEGYAPFAMTTVGDVFDYKHFLPRILELSTSQDCTAYGLGAEMITNKLLYGKYDSWPADEREAVRSFLKAAFLHSCQSRIINSSPGEWIIALARIGYELDFICDSTFPITPATKVNRALALKELLAWLISNLNDPEDATYAIVKEWLLNSNTEEMLLVGIQYTNEDYACELEDAFNKFQTIKASSKSEITPTK